MRSSEDKARQGGEVVEACSTRNLKPLDGEFRHRKLGGNLGNFKISLMVSIEVRIHKYV